MIRKKDIQGFIERHFEIENIMVNDRTLSLYRGYFYYMCYKYCDEVINNSILARYSCLKQHGTVGNSLAKICDGLFYDKRIKLEVSTLERCFLSEFQVSDIVLDVMSLNEINLKRQLVNLKNENRKIKEKINNLRSRRRYHEKLS